MTGGTEVICGDAREVLRGLPERSVHACVTSPPYWGLRDYGLEPVIWGGDLAGCPHEWGEVVTPAANGIVNSEMQGKTLSGNSATRKPRTSAFCRRCSAWRGSLGLEPTPELFVAHIVEVMREVRRVLRDDGTLWLNMGDGYASNPAKGGSGTFNGRNGRGEGYARPLRKASAQGADVGDWTGRSSELRTVDAPLGLKPKDLLLMPARVALALQADGWWLRSDIIWSKPNPMPESVTDRPTRSHEYVFLLSKASRYFYDADAIREPHTALGRPPGNKSRIYFDRDVNHHNGQKRRHGEEHSFHEAGRNKRSVWEIATQPYPDAHFATFPEKLVEPCIMAGTSEWGCCPECGAPWARVVEKGDLREHPDREGRSVRNVAFDGEGYSETGGTLGLTRETRTTGWRRTCDHEGQPVAALVCDPFAGSGTVGVVAARLGRRAVLIDANPDYCEMARHRTAQMGLLSQMTGTTTETETATASREAPVLRPA